ncbi:MAG: alpha-L-fucosidase [Clostridia bacterium]|nr:alpha-L-fucosidase [Clostridia bacterium]
MVDSVLRMKEIDSVIRQGPYQDNWASLAAHPVPKWYQEAKFGIFIHWGVYSVPAFGSEWYPRNMYLPGSPEYQHHIENYGPHQSFGYADFIPLFKAEHFDAEQWAGLFAASGARYVVPVAEHHDGFQMYESSLSDWNAAKMGPQKDVLGLLKKAVEKRGLILGTSSHRAENYWFFNGCRTFDSGLQHIEFQEPYGYASPDVQPEMTHDVLSAGPCEAHLENWLLRTCELIDRYQPKLLWFDWWIHNHAFKPYLKKLAAYYYNRSEQWGEAVAINYKYDAFVFGTAVYDIERGQLSGISRTLWQNDTAIAKNSWGYTKNNDYKNPSNLICDLVDITSKNGCLLLNIGPQSDGIICEAEEYALRHIGAWLAKNGEAIYGTSPWKIFGEGSTQIEEGSFTDANRPSFKPDDIRFTWKAPDLYAIVLRWPADGQVCIRSLKNQSDVYNGLIRNVRILGFEDWPVQWRRTDEGLWIDGPKEIKSDDPVSLKLELG